VLINGMHMVHILEPTITVKVCTLTISKHLFFFFFIGYHNRLKSRIAKYHPNIWAFIKCIQGEENIFHHLLIQMKGDVSARSKTKKTQAVQDRIDTLYLPFQNKDINSEELLEGLSYVVAKNIKAKKKTNN
jgi:hypothetical protein